MTNVPVSFDSEPVDQNIFPVAAIGGSAGGIEACSTLLRELPEETGIAFIIIQHLSADSPSMLASVLARETAMPVVEGESEMAIQPNHIYVIPPDKVMTLTDGHIALSPRDSADQPFMPIDNFFESLADIYQNRAIGIVLSGLDDDGAEGLRKIRQSGGITFAQTEMTAQFSNMPTTAIETGGVDFILPPAEIARALTEIAQHPYLSHPELIAINQPAQKSPEASPEQQAEESLEADAAKGSTESLEEGPDESSEENTAEREQQARAVDEEDDLSQIYALLKATTDTDFSQYKRTTFERRLKRRMALHRINSIEAYVKYLQENLDEVEALYRDVLIVVTNFFRNAETFAFLKEVVFPSILKEKGLDASIRLWVAVILIMKIS